MGASAPTRSVCFFGKSPLTVSVLCFPTGSTSEESGESVCLAAKDCGSSHEASQ